MLQQVGGRGGGATLDGEPARDSVKYPGGVSNYICQCLEVLCVAYRLARLVHPDLGIKLWTFK